ncbi:mersacidin/lichenicidin family type 2 lantibiotic [Solibacillus cecembensis]|uniref:mersacidin/lichenicidin family type 2 lantibiotic n=1 Tax=Solibacillus cecembensis TaxID=459347 RepID=UPI0007171B97
MSNQEIIQAWKNPKKRNQVMTSHPSGTGFHELNEQEMMFIAGGNGEVETQATPLLTTLTPATPAISWGGAVSAVSGLVSYTKDCI